MVLAAIDGVVSWPDSWRTRAIEHRVHPVPNCGHAGRQPPQYCSAVPSKLTALPPGETPPILPSGSCSNLPLDVMALDLIGAALSRSVHKARSLPCHGEEAS